MLPFSEDLGTRLISRASPRRRMALAVGCKPNSKAAGQPGGSASMPTKESSPSCAMSIVISELARTFTLCQLAIQWRPVVFVAPSEERYSRSSPGRRPEGTRAAGSATPIPPPAACTGVVRKNSKSRVTPSGRGGGGSGRHPAHAERGGGDGRPTRPSDLHVLQASCGGYFHGGAAGAGGGRSGGGQGYREAHLCRRCPIGRCHGNGDGGPLGGHRRYPGNDATRRADGHSRRTGDQREDERASAAITAGQLEGRRDARKQLPRGGGGASRIAVLGR